MGPRSDERGNDQFTPAEPDPAKLASMGPRSDERGNTVRSRAIAWYFSMLQWGRARMSAEINPIVSGGLEGLRASMGPRSDERGNVFSSAECRRAWACFNGAALG